MGLFRRHRGHSTPVGVDTYFSPNLPHPVIQGASLVRHYLPVPFTAVKTSAPSLGLPLLVCRGPVFPGDGSPEGEAQLIRSHVQNVAVPHDDLRVEAESRAAGAPGTGGSGDASPARSTRNGARRAGADLQRHEAGLITPLTPIAHPRSHQDRPEHGGGKGQVENLVPHHHGGGPDREERQGGDPDQPVNLVARGERCRPQLDGGVVEPTRQGAKIRSRVLRGHLEAEIEQMRMKLPLLRVSDVRADLVNTKG